VDVVPLASALGRVTAEATLSPVDLPLFRNSQMDGFAVHSADVPGSLPIVGVIAAAATAPQPLEPGTAVRIMTGAVVPEGADVVVPVEATVVDGSMVTITGAFAAGDFVREQGSDLRAGSELLPARLRLGSRHLAVLAAAGLATVRVQALYRVAVITTGAELLAPGQTPTLGQIFDSNAVALVAAIQAAGAIVSHEARVTDDHATLLTELHKAAARSDLIITSGGISMGDYEVVRETLQPLGGNITTIAMQPGGPQATAEIDGTPVICFPGNPVSTQLSFEIFVGPLLRSHAGLPAASRETRALRQPVESPAGKRQFLRGVVVEGLLEAVAGPGSHLVAGLAASTVLIDIPADVTHLNAGDRVETITL
jgi:molybdopterin molybdotransferase